MFRGVHKPESEEEDKVRRMCSEKEEREMDRRVKREGEEEGAGGCP